MGRLVLIDVVLTSAAMGLWYAWFARHNRRKAAAVLAWVQAACGSKARILKTTWRSCSLLHARLHFPSRLVDSARVTVSLMPRPLPVQWMLSRWRKQKETLTFEADLGLPPGFSLDVIHHRWAGHSGRRATDERHWTIVRSLPVVLTTRDDWPPELTPIINALVSRQEKNFLTVKFHQGSPHLTATVPLESLSDAKAVAGLLDMFRELANGVSAKRQ